ncbi:MAG: MFS transporter [Rubripirellula sp.]
MKSNLFKQGFLSLVATQFFGAMNDNALKMVLVFMVTPGNPWADQFGSGSVGFIGFCFAIPFVLLSGFAGQVADRHSKRTVTRWVKGIEIPIALIGGIGFFTDNIWITLLALIALACQSAFFGPAKYGMIPELVDSSDLSRANGTINMMTNVAVILGTWVGGKVFELYRPKPDPPAVGVVVEAAEGMMWLPCAALLAIALAGFAAMMFMTPLKVGDSNLKYNYNPFSTYVGVIREMSKTRLLMVMMAWGYFYMLATIALSIIPEYEHVLGVTASEASALMGVLGVSVGIGCAVAGLISGHHIEPRLVPIGAAGLIVFFVLLAAVEPSLPQLPNQVRVVFSNVGFFIFGAGFFSGFYIIPLQSLLQKLSPDEERGRFLGTANAVSFSFMAISGLLFLFTRGMFDKPQHMFYLCAALMAVGAAFFLWKLRGTGIIFGTKDGDGLADQSTTVSVADSTT